MGGALRCPRQSRTSSDLAHLINVEGGDECQEGMVEVPDEEEDEVSDEQAGQKEDRQEDKNEREVDENRTQRTFLDFCTMSIVVVILVVSLEWLEGETGANGPNLTPNFGTQGEKSGLSWTQIWTQFDGNFRPRLALI